MNKQKPIISNESFTEIFDSHFISAAESNQQTDRLKNQQTINPLLEKMYGKEL